MLLSLPRLDLRRRNEAGGQDVEPLMRILELSVYQTDARNQRGNVCAGGLDRTGSDCTGGLRSVSST